MAEEGLRGAPPVRNEMSLAAAARVWGRWRCPSPPTRETPSRPRWHPL